ncbi:hypothetical protein Fmac_013224 [Flemingia macrophylla]|uniref:Mediator of RNA polymerase II transcription subunit 20 n=1 Tax=Flemingia macrophylla TaxID=520843 RepID=A0ABD1MTF9_9FABA
MPVRSVLYWKPNQGNVMTNEEVMSKISECIETLHGVEDQECHCHACVTFYTPILRDERASFADLPQDFVGVLMMEQLNKQFFVMQSRWIVVEADSLILPLIEKLSSYKPKSYITLNGTLYKMGDFQIRLFKVLPDQGNLKGIIAEIEYLPISSIEQSKKIMEEMVDTLNELASKKSLEGHFVQAKANYAKYGLDDDYTSQHTAVQYAATSLTELIQSALRSHDN